MYSVEEITKWSLNSKRLSYPKLLKILYNLHVSSLRYNPITRYNIKIRRKLSKYKRIDRLK